MCGKAEIARLGAGGTEVQGLVAIGQAMGGLDAQDLAHLPGSLTTLNGLAHLSRATLLQLIASGHDQSIDEVVAIIGMTIRGVEGANIIDRHVLPEAGVKNLGAPLYTGLATHFPSSPSGVFAEAGAGKHYLANNTYRDSGSSSINPALSASLRIKTTHPPSILSGPLSVSRTLQPQAALDTSDLDTDTITSHWTTLSATSWLAASRSTSKTGWPLALTAPGASPCAMAAA